MAATLAQARKELAKRLGLLLEGSVAASPAPSSTSIADQALVDNARWLDLRDAFIRFASGLQQGAVRRITSADPAQGILAWGVPLSSAPAADDAYEVYQRGHPRDYDAAINSALRGLYWVDQVRQTAAGTDTVSVPAGISHPSDILNVWHERGTAPYQRRTLMWHQVIYDNGALTVRISPPYTTGNILVDVRRYYPQLSADSDLTDCPLELLMPNAEYQWWRLMPLRLGSLNTEERRVYQEEEAKAFARAKAITNWYLPPLSRPRLPAAPWQPLL